MKRFAVLPVLAVLVIIFAAGRPVQQELPDADVAAIKGILDSWSKAQLAEDVDAAMAQWDENIVHIRPGAVTVSKDTVAAQMRAIVGDRDEKVVDFGTIEISGQGTLAFAWGIATETVRYPDAEEDVTWVFPWVASFRKMDDGTWKVIAFII